MGVISSLGDAPGNPVIDRNSCTACGACAAICPLEVLTQTATGIAIDNAAMFGCIACGQCMMVCPAHCISVTGRRLHPDDIVDLPMLESRADADQLAALLLARRSIRKFTGDDVPRLVIDQVLAVAATAPMGIPPWEVGVTVFHGRDKVAELARDTADSYRGFLKLFDNAAMKQLSRLFMKKSVWQQFQSFILPLGRILVKGKERGTDYVFYNAPAALMFHSSPYCDSADAIIACTYAMIAAESLGLGTCMIGCSAPVVGRRRDLLKKYGLPEGNSPKIILIMGYHASPHRKAIRRSFQSLNYY
ncbi:nitroreductase family protein [Geotalea uraniireducens]|uniref:Nitroreductase n=1 Tax=Geotalea uraniireducens (strain Rf4) TaxID=351605 RepID=A5G496_GEOUR|nr:nitroreductase family protein [Geotalea uraniireducens]ABQ26614.1 nitroreductase [Geotalea uraniireducens Rf4]